MTKKLYQLAAFVSERNFSRKELDRLLLAVCYLLPLIGIFDGECFETLSFIYIGAIVYFAFSRELLALYPLFFFFYELLVAPGDIVVYRLYTVVFIFRFVYLNFGKKPSIRPEKLSICALLCFAALVFLKGGHFVGVGVLIDLIFMLCFICELGDGEERLSVFFSFFVFASLASCLVGFFKDGYLDQLLAGGENTEELRYLATLEDPNYLGFYLNVAIAAVLLHPFFKRLWLKLPALAVLYAAVFASASVTAMLANIITLAVCGAFLIYTGRIKPKCIPLFLIGAVICLQLWTIAPESELPIVSEAVERWQDKFESLSEGKISDFTTARTDIWLRHMDIYSELSFKEQLLGGNYITAFDRDGDIFDTASHEEYMDIMFGVGAVGLIFFVICALLSVCGELSRAKKIGEIGYIRVTVKLIWLFYAFGLTMFMNTRFYILFLI